MPVLGLRRHSSGLGLSPRRRVAKGSALPSIVQAGLVAEWRFDDGAGQVLTDSTGNGNHGQLGSTTGADAADPTWTAQGLSFDGGDFVDCGTLGIAGTQARTLIYVGRSSGTGSTQLMSAQWNESTSAGLRWTLRAVNSGGLKVRLEFEGGGQTSALPVVQNAWHFVGATQAGANANTCVIYANGASEAVTVNLALDTQNSIPLRPPQQPRPGLSACLRSGLQPRPLASGSRAEPSSAQGDSCPARDHPAVTRRGLRYRGGRRHGQYREVSVASCPAAQRS